MISKALLRKRLGVALGKPITPSDFSWFFACFCEKTGRKELRTAKELTYEDADLFGRYCGYDLHFPIPLPLLEAQI